MDDAVAQCRTASTHAAGFLKAALPAGASRGDRISEMASGSMHNGCLTRFYLAVEWSVTTTWLTIALWPVPPPWGGEVDRGSKGEVGTTIDVPPQVGLLFQPTTPASSATTISKIPLKPAAPPRLRALVSPF
jgi:hypothetical protein